MDTYSRLQPQAQLVERPLTHIEALEVHQH